MSDLEREIDRDIYELTEAELKAKLAFSQIESKYRVKHMVMESSGQFTNEELLAMEEADKEAESGDKRSVIRKLIDTILEKIRSFINRFKKSKDTYELGPDDKVNMPVSEDEIRAYIKSADTITEKLDKVLQAAKGDSKKAYDDALKEYEEATQNADWLDSISDEVLNAEKNTKAGKKVGNYIIRGSIIMAAIAAAKKILEAGEKVTVAVGEAIASGTGKVAGTVAGASSSLFGRFKEKDIDIENEANNLGSKINKLTTRIGKLDKFFNKVLNRKATNMKREKFLKDNEANKDALDDEADDLEGATDLEKTAFNKHRDVDFFPWFNKYFKGNLDELASHKYGRPNYNKNDKEKMSRYFINTNGGVGDVAAKAGKKIAKGAADLLHRATHESVEDGLDTEEIFTESKKDKDFNTVVKGMKNGDQLWTNRFTEKQVGNGLDYIASRDITFNSGVTIKSGESLCAAFGRTPPIPGTGSMPKRNVGEKITNAAGKKLEGGLKAVAKKTEQASEHIDNTTAFKGDYTKIATNAVEKYKKGSGAPIFFDFWGIMFKHGNFDKYKDRQHELFTAYNKARADNGMPEITWGKSQALKALKAMLTGKPIDDRGNRWRYDEDAGSNPSSGGGSTDGDNDDDDGSKSKFLEKFYQTKDSSTLNADINRYIKDSKSSEVSSSTIYGISIANIKKNFPNRKDEFVKDFDDMIDKDKSIKGSDEVKDFITAIHNNGLKWKAKDFRRYEDSDGALKSAYNDTVKLMTRDYGWSKDYLS